MWIPCYQVLRHRSLQQETLDTIALWESRTRGGVNKSFSREQDSSRTPTAVTLSHEKMDSADTGRYPAGSIESHSTESLFTMHALEHTLNQNPDPLRTFASLRDFSGENIAFLTAVREWKALWTKLCDAPDAASRTEVNQRCLFKHALRIYANYVSLKYATFPVNIGAQDQQKLESIFGVAARTLYGDGETSLDSEITPFGSRIDPSAHHQPQPARSWAQDVLLSLGNNRSSNAVDFVTENVDYWGHIPNEFSGGVFNSAEKSIKYLVLTNTWPKFIREHRLESLNSKSSRG